jgi:uncharacterized repeat protein (TIGR03803 family)
MNEPLAGSNNRNARITNRELRRSTLMRRIVSLLAAGVCLAIVGVASGQSCAADLTTLVSFCSLANCADGDFPIAGLIADANGNLFGTTIIGGSGAGEHNRGTVFEIAKTATGYAIAPTTLFSFCSVTNCADGANPVAGLIADADGNLFGTTYGGGANGVGTVFEIVKTTSGYASTPTTLVSFNGYDGANPRAGLIADAKGNLFGTTFGGGAHNGGTVFEIARTATGYAITPTTLVSFCSLTNCADGANPVAGLIADAKGNLFGTTFGGGENGLGTVFEIARTATGYAITPTTLFSFCSLANCADGLYPVAGLIADAKGNLFGTTFGGGANGLGTVFEIAKTTTGYAITPTTLVSFCSLTNCADGANPAAGLIVDADGDLFGTTRSGGANGAGTVFEVTNSGFVIFAGTPGKPVPVLERRRDNTNGSAGNNALTVFSEHHPRSSCN